LSGDVDKEKRLDGPKEEDGGELVASIIEAPTP
jgi:hypothetical protein